MNDFLPVYRAYCKAVVFSAAGEQLAETEGSNLITDAGLAVMLAQMYQTTGILTNGFNYIGLSNDSFTETSSSTTLSSEITTNGLGRAQGTVNISGNQVTIAKTFTATGTQSAQKAALFTASSSGTMQHPIAFDAQLSLTNTQQLVVTFTITRV